MARSRRWHRRLGWLGALGLAVACSKTPGGGAKKIPRDKDAQAVVVVEAPESASVSFSDEVEPNGDISQATPLALGAGARGSLDGETDVDIYGVEVAEAGLLDARLSGIEGVDLILELLDSDGKVLVRSDRGPAEMIEGLPNVPVDPGSYHLAVREFVKKRRRRRRRRKGKKAEGRTGPSPRYELVVKTRSAERHHEVEPNDEPEQATEVFIGDEVHGYMGWARDVDMWKLSVEGFGSHYSLDIDVQGVPEVTFKLSVLDDSGKAVVTRKGRKGEGVSVRNLVVVEDAEDDGEGSGDTKRTAKPGAEDAPGYFHARLSARRSNPIDAYRLRMSTRLLDMDEEVEPNDEPDTAMALRPQPEAARGVRRGHLTPGDVDRYRLDAGSEPVLLLVSAKPAGDIDIELDVTVDGETLGMANARPARGEESLADLRIEAGGVAIVTVSGKGGLGDDAAYQLEWSVEPVAGVPLQDDTSDMDSDLGSDLGGLDDYEE